MATYPSPEAARAAHAGGTSNAAEAVKASADSKRSSRQPTTVPGYIDKVFDITGATDTGP